MQTETNWNPGATGEDILKSLQEAKAELDAMKPDPEISGIVVRPSLPISPILIMDPEDRKNYWVIDRAQFLQLRDLAQRNEPDSIVVGSEAWSGIFGIPIIENEKFYFDLLERIIGELFRTAEKDFNQASLKP